MGVTKDNVIKSINYDQHAILRDIMVLHNNGEPFDCDMTYSVGNFYGKFKETIDIQNEDGTIDRIVSDYEIPQPKYKFDVDPQVDGVEQIDPWGPIPLPDNSINSIVIDLPFVIGPRNCASMYNKKKGSNVIGKRFSSYYPRQEMFSSYEHWIKEAYRVLKPGGILVFKSQNVISGGVNLMTSHYSCTVAEDCGFYIKDEFVLVAKMRLLSGKVKNQEHSRRFHSFFHVFEKDNPKKDKIGYWERQWTTKRDGLQSVKDMETSYENYIDNGGNE